MRAVLGLLSMGMVAVAGLAGCAGNPAFETGEGGAGAAAIYVREFGFAEAVVDSNLDPRQREDLKASVAREVQERLVDRLKELGPASAAPVRLPDAGWLVEGDYLELIDGSVLRYLIGFGKSGAGVSARVKIYNLAAGTRAPVELFEVPDSVARLDTDKARRVVSTGDLAARVRERLGARLAPPAAR